MMFCLRLGHEKRSPPANRDFITYVTSFFCVFSTITSLLSDAAKAILPAMSTDGSVHTRRMYETRTHAGHCARRRNRHDSGNRRGDRSTTTAYTAATERATARCYMVLNAAASGCFIQIPTPPRRTLRVTFTHTCTLACARDCYRRPLREDEAPFEISTVGCVTSARARDKRRRRRR